MMIMDNGNSSGDDNGNSVGDDNGDAPFPGIALIPKPEVQVERVDLILSKEEVTKLAAASLDKMKVSSSTVQSTVDHMVTEISNLFSDVISALKSRTELFLQSKGIEDKHNLCAPRWQPRFLSFLSIFIFYYYQVLSCLLYSIAKSAVVIANFLKIPSGKLGLFLT